MQTQKSKVFNAIKTSVLICTIITVINWIQSPNFNFVQFVFSKAMLAGFIMGFFLYLTASFTFYLIRKIIPEDPYYLRRMLLFTPFSILSTCIVVFGVNFIFYSINNSISISGFIDQQSFRHYINIVAISIICSVLIYSFNFYKHYKENQLKMQTQIASSATARFESLKHQIDPHFLFNSLNVLTSLIEENQRKAIAYTNSLSRIYRYILEQKDNRTISIAQEIAFTQNYINLLKLRFEDAISYQIDSDVMHLKGDTIPLALQIVLENCIQHNIATEKKKLHIHISTDQKNLIITNNLLEKKNKKISTKIGLSNIMERYNLLTNKQVQIIKDNNTYTIQLPIINAYD